VGSFLDDTTHSTGGVKVSVDRKWGNQRRECRWPKMVCRGALNMCCASWRGHATIDARSATKVSCLALVRPSESGSIGRATPISVCPLPRFATSASPPLLLVELALRLSHGAGHPPEHCHGQRPGQCLCHPCAIHHGRQSFPYGP
jgi:hypothetical protein